MTHPALQTLLKIYMENGIDVFLNDQPVNKYIQAPALSKLSAPVVKTLADFAHYVDQSNVPLTFKMGGAHKDILLVVDRQQWVDADEDLLLKMLGAIGLDLSEITVLSLHGASVTQKDLETFVHLAAPRLALLMGSQSVVSALGDGENILKIRGQWRTVAGVQFMPVLSAHYLRHTPSHKKLAWEDLQNFEATRKKTDA